MADILKVSFTPDELMAIDKAFEKVVSSDTHPLFTLWELMTVLKEDGEIIFIVGDSDDER